MSSSRLHVAFLVQEADDEPGVVVFEKDRDSARNKGAELLGVSLRQLKKCTRLEQVDHLAGLPVPPATLLGLGYVAMCEREHCFGVVHPGEVAMDTGGRAFCCEGCAAAA